MFGVNNYYDSSEDRKRLCTNAIMISCYSENFAVLRNFLRGIKWFLWSNVSRFLPDVRAECTKMEDGSVADRFESRTWLQAYASWQQRRKHADLVPGQWRGQL